LAGENLMPVLQTRIDTRSDAFAANRAHMLGLIEQLRALEARTRTASERARDRFAERGQLLPRERIGRLLDLGSPWLELAPLAGYLQDDHDPDKSIPGARVIAGIGYVSGVRCAVAASDSGIDAGALGAMSLEKMLRVQRLALDNKLPFVHLVESAGANLLAYRVDGFVHGGALFANLARLSAAGLPVLTVVHGSSTAGGAYMPGLSDYVVMVRGRARAFLAGPPLLRAATGEVATEEDLGGAEMHARVSGLAEYVGADDADALRIAREVVGHLGWGPAPPASGPAPLYDPEELLGIMPTDLRQPVDMREVLARIVDRSEFLEFKPDYGSATVVGHAALDGTPVGVITNNGPLDPDGAAKATHFIQVCCQSGTPLVYFQNTTGYIVGAAYEAAGMIKHGSKMIQAVTLATVPQLTVMCGASFGAGNYGMCGRGFEPRFLFGWPNAETAVMGPQQAATTMALVMEEGAKRRGQPVDPAAASALEARIVERFRAQTSAFVTSGLLLDDGLIDPRDTRRALSLALSVCLDGDGRTVRPIQFGVARP
jgi:geranyl-CoA carboxylase beta subunit